MPVCDGKGNAGTHCCWIDGQECEFVVWLGDRAWCGVWNLMDRPEWHASTIGRKFAEWYPGKGYTCRDYPQNIEGFPAGGRCCWKGRM